MHQPPTGTGLALCNRQATVYRLFAYYLIKRICQLTLSCCLFQWMHFPHDLGCVVDWSVNNGGTGSGSPRLGPQNELNQNWKQSAISPPQVPYQRDAISTNKASYVFLTHLRRKIKGIVTAQGGLWKKVVRQNPIIKANHLVHTPHFFWWGNKPVLYLLLLLIYSINGVPFPAQVNNCAQITSIHTRKCPPILILYLSMPP